MNFRYTAGRKASDYRRPASCRRGERRFCGGRVTCRSAPDTQRPTAVTLAPTSEGGLARTWSIGRIPRHTPLGWDHQPRSVARNWSPRRIPRHTPAPGGRERPTARRFASGLCPRPRGSARFRFGSTSTWPLRWPPGSPGNQSSGGSSSDFGSISVTPPGNGGLALNRPASARRPPRRRAPAPRPPRAGTPPWQNRGTPDPREHTDASQRPGHGRPRPALPNHPLVTGLHRPTDFVTSARPPRYVWSCSL